MPFCPVCHYEYVEGIEKCSDCGVELVNRLPSKLIRKKRGHPPATNSKPIPDNVKIVTVATFYYLPDADIAKTYLDAEGILCTLAGNTIVQVNPFRSIIEPIRLMVREEDAERALEILNRKPEA